MNKQQGGRAFAEPVTTTGGEMKATTEKARSLATEARAFNHPMIPKRGKMVIEISAAMLADIVERLERLEASQGGENAKGER